MGKKYFLHPDLPRWAGAATVPARGGDAAEDGGYPGELGLVETWSRDRSAHLWLVQGQYWASLAATSLDRVAMSHLQVTRVRIPQFCHQ